ncbi:hypothetical protein RHA1_ro10156 (plasmid) [Rhodococcus jostii RHA1]|uniref:Uncharacterized protein n=1 Tax=Rhodococcus jostii (strain RHA1) TaxID=101510 RepID=Q0RWI7_RHOJR|nr:hypothetical protein RHA1_ro10156 [Rhodococcus jostii RHA1]
MDLAVEQDGSAGDMEAKSSASSHRQHRSKTQRSCSFEGGCSARPLLPSQGTRVSVASWRELAYRTKSRRRQRGVLPSASQHRRRLG